MAIVSLAIVISFHLNAPPSALERRVARPLGLIFWFASLVCLAAGVATYVKAVTKYSRREALVQSGSKTQAVSSKKQKKNEKKKEEKRTKAKKKPPQKRERERERERECVCLSCAVLMFEGGRGGVFLQVYIFIAFTVITTCLIFLATQARSLKGKK